MQLYRYLETQHIESFFDTGDLMLTSFARCQKLEGAHGDPRDGEGNFYIATPGGQGIAGIFGASTHTHLLCTSRELSEHLKRKFEREDYFVIKRPAHFSSAVAECLQDVRSFEMGDCSYSDNGYETSSSGVYEHRFPAEHESMSEPELEEWLDKEHRTFSDSLRATLGNRGVFTKRFTPYHDEAEFRFAWTLGSPVPETKVYSCLDAVRYCKRR